MTVDNEDFDDTVVCLDTYNSDLNLVIDASRFSAYPLTSEGFAFMWSGARATYGVVKGKMCFEVKVVKHLDVAHLPDDEVNPHVIRVGFSVESTSMQLGEEPLSFGYGGTGKMSTNCQFKDYGVPFMENDIIMGLLNMDSDPVQIGFAKNGKFLGWASKVNKSQLCGKALFPHVLSKNCSFEVNFGQKDVPYFKNPEGFGDHTFIGCIPLDQRLRGTRAPQRREDCEMIMMCGLPGAGKSYWAAEYCLKHPEKKYNVLGTNNIIDKMKVMGLPRKRNYAGRWEVLIQMATKCINKMFEIGSKLRRNYILDQTNVYPTAQRRKMRNFEGFRRKGVVVVPSEEEFQKRTNKRERVEGKDVPDSAVLEMKANFKLPDVGDIFDEVIFTELQREEAEKLVRSYNEEGRMAVGPPNKRFRGASANKDHSPARPLQSHNSGFERDRAHNFGGGSGPRGSWNDSMPSSPYNRDSPNRSPYGSGAFRGRGSNHGGRGRPEADYGGSGDYLGRGGHHGGYGGRGASNDYPTRVSHSSRGSYRGDFGGRGQGEFGGRGQGDFGGRGQGDFGGRGMAHDDYRDGGDYGKMGGSYDNYRGGSSYGGDRDFKESFDNRSSSDFGPRSFKSERFGPGSDGDRERKPFDDSMGPTGSYMGYSNSPQGISDGSRGDYGSRSGPQGDYGRRGGNRGGGRGGFGGRSGSQSKFSARGGSQTGYGGQGGGSQSGYGRDNMQSSYSGSSGYGGGFPEDSGQGGSYGKDGSYGYGTDSRSSSGAYNKSDREPQNSYKSASTGSQGGYGGYTDRSSQSYGGRSQIGGGENESQKSYSGTRSTQGGYSSAYGSGSTDAYPGSQNNNNRGRPGNNRSGIEKNNWSKDTSLTPTQQSGTTTQAQQPSSYSSYTTADSSGTAVADTGYAGYSTQPQSYGQSAAAYQQPAQQAQTYSYQQPAQQSQPSQPQSWGQPASTAAQQTQQPQAAAAAPQAWSQYYQQTQQQQQQQYYSQYYGLPATNQGYGGT